MHMGMRQAELKASAPLKRENDANNVFRPSDSPVDVAWKYLWTAEDTWP
jgi:hypothetical protein